MTPRPELPDIPAIDWPRTIPPTVPAPLREAYATAVLATKQAGDAVLAASGLAGSLADRGPRDDPARTEAERVRAVRDAVGRLVEAARRERDWEHRVLGGYQPPLDELEEESLWARRMALANAAFEAHCQVQQIAAGDMGVEWDFYRPHHRAWRHFYVPDPDPDCESEKRLFTVTFLPDMAVIGSTIVE